jgi:hypothetical protein
MTSFFFLVLTVRRMVLQFFHQILLDPNSDNGYTSKHGIL